MYFAGIQRTSLLDYPGKVCAILFTDMCNFRCGFCHNSELVGLIPEDQRIPEKKAFELLLARKYLVDAVSITGGEPTMQKDLPMFIKKLKDAGFFVKMDTNGTNPSVLEEVLPLLDFVAMDIKAPLDAENYQKVVSVPVDITPIKKSVQLIMESGVPYEFRTTVVPDLHPQDMLEGIGKSIQGAKKLALQQFVRSEKVLDPSFREKRVYEPDELRTFQKLLKNYVDDVELRGI